MSDSSNPDGSMIISIPPQMVVQAHALADRAAAAQQQATAQARAVATATPVVKPKEQPVIKAGEHPHHKAGHRRHRGRPRHRRNFDTAGEKAVIRDVRAAHDPKGTPYAEIKALQDKGVDTGRFGNHLASATEIKAADALTALALADPTHHNYAQMAGAGKPGGTLQAELDTEKSSSHSSGHSSTHLASAARKLTPKI